MILTGTVLWGRHLQRPYQCTGVGWAQQSTEGTGPLNTEQLKCGELRWATCDGRFLSQRFLRAWESVLWLFVNWDMNECILNNPLFCAWCVMVNAIIKATASTCTSTLVFCAVILLLWNYLLQFAGVELELGVDLNVTDKPALIMRRQAGVDYLYTFDTFEATAPPQADFAIPPECPTPPKKRQWRNLNAYTYTCWFAYVDLDELFFFF